MIFNNLNPFVGKKGREMEYCVFFYNYLFDKCISLFEWKGKEFEGPDATLNRDYLEFMLLTQGQAAFIKDNDGLLRGLTCTRVGLDPYGFPMMITSANPVLGELTGIVNKDCVWIRDNKFAIPATSKISYFAQQLAKAQLSLDISLNNNRMTKIFRAENTAQAKQIAALMSDVNEGKEAVIVKGGLLSNIMGEEDKSIPVFGTPSEYLAANYIQDMRNIMNNFLITFGVNCNGGNVVKKQVNLLPEIDSNNQEIIINREYWLSTRKQACDIANELFGTDLSVDIKKPDKQDFDLTKEIMNSETNVGGDNE